MRWSRVSRRCPTGRWFGIGRSCRGRRRFSAVHRCPMMPRSWTRPWCVWERRCMGTLWSRMRRWCVAGFPGRFRLPPGVVPGEERRWQGWSVGFRGGAKWGWSRSGGERGWAVLVRMSSVMRSFPTAPGCSSRPRCSARRRSRAGRGCSSMPRFWMTAGCMTKPRFLEKRWCLDFHRQSTLLTDRAITVNLSFQYSNQMTTPCDCGLTPITPRMGGQYSQVSSRNLMRFKISIHLWLQVRRQDSGSSGNAMSLRSKNPCLQECLAMWM